MIEDRYFPARGLSWLRCPGFLRSLLGALILVPLVASAQFEHLFGGSEDDETEAVEDAAAAVDPEEFARALRAANNYLKGRDGYAKDEARAISVLQVYAYRGYLPAQLALAKLVLQVESRDRRYEEGMEWFLKASDGGADIDAEDLKARMDVLMRVRNDTNAVQTLLTGPFEGAASAGQWPPEQPAVLLDRHDDWLKLYRMDVGVTGWVPVAAVAFLAPNWLVARGGSGNSRQMSAP